MKLMCHSTDVELNTVAFVTPSKGTAVGLGGAELGAGLGAAKSCRRCRRSAVGAYVS